MVKQAKPQLFLVTKENENTLLKLFIPNFHKTPFVQHYLMHVISGYYT